MSLPESLGEWHPLLKEEFDKTYMKRLGSYIGTNKDKVTPAPSNMFKAFSLTPPGKTKVIILGQDPYYQPGYAHGLSFSTANGITPKSLQVIFKSIEEAGYGSRKDSNLTDWAKQGVLLLNTLLTTETGKPLAHKGWGWEDFTGKVLRLISYEPHPKVFMLWGAEAKAFGEKYIWSTVNNLVLRGPHPAARFQPFDNTHFVKANQFLQKNNLTPIKWA